MVGNCGQHLGISEPGRHLISDNAPVSFLPEAPGNTGMCSRAEVAPARTEYLSFLTGLWLSPRAQRSPKGKTLCEPLRSQGVQSSNPSKKTLLKSYDGKPDPEQVPIASPAHSPSANETVTLCFFVREEITICN